MGAGISQAAGFYRAYAAGGREFPTIVATIVDSTFFHAGIPALLNAVFHQARFILVILDNATTAMTGHQPTPQVGRTALGEAGRPVLIPDLVRACGVGFLREADPYDLPAFMDLLKAADGYCRSPAGGVAVVIAKHPCLLDREARRSQTVYDTCVTEDCTGCRHCLDDFECPALTLDETDGRVMIDGVRCVGCGVCVHVCPEGAITARQKGGA
jgi:indolepyruvate ferredoxin oxidoreductase alpha subunit